MLGSIAVVGTRVEALNLAEEMGASGRFSGVTVYGREPEAPAHTVFARGLAAYVYGLEPLHAETMAVLLAVADEGVPETAFSVAGQGDAPPGCAAFHLSPVLPTDALAPLHALGYSLGTFHPLGGSAESSRGAAAVAGGYVAVTGSPSAIAVARRITDALDAEVLEVPAGRRPLVDAATVMAGSYLEPLIALSSRLMERAGIAAEDATPALVAVARAALARVERGERVAAPAHPARDGDLERLALHLRALDADDQRLYALFAAEILRLEGGVADAPTRAAMDELLNRYLEPQPTSVG